MDKKETPYKPKVYQNRHRNQGRGRQSKTNPLVNTRIGMKGTIITMTGIIDQTIEIGLEIIIEGMTENLHISLMTDVVIADPIIRIEATTTDKTIEVDRIIEIMTLDRDMEIKSESRDRSRNYSNDRDRGRNRGRDRD